MNRKNVMFFDFWVLSETYTFDVAIFFLPSTTYPVKALLFSDLHNFIEL